MKTLAQVRAYNALKCKHSKLVGQQGGEVISKLPALIQNDGLLATFAFCLDKGEDHKKIVDIIAEHLSDEHIEITKASDADGLIYELASSEDAALLRRATAETLAFLNYMKRISA